MSLLGRGNFDRVKLFFLPTLMCYISYFSTKQSTGTSFLEILTSKKSLSFIYRWPLKSVFCRHTLTTVKQVQNWFLVPCTSHSWYWSWSVYGPMYRCMRLFLVYDNGSYNFNRSICLWIDADFCYWRGDTNEGYLISSWS